MSTSTIIFLSAVGCGVLFAGCAVFALLNDGADAQRNNKRGKAVTVAAPRSRLRWALPVVILAVCTAFGGLAYLLDSDIAETTLYEVDAAGPGAVAPSDVSFEIPVEHAGAEHDLLVAPGSVVSVGEPVQLKVRVTDPTGAVVLDESQALEPRCDGFCEWDSYSGYFTPPTTGTYVLVVTVQTPGVEDLHVRVGDPEKTDGQRAPGY